MESNSPALIVETKNTAICRFLNKSSYVKKIASYAATLFFPWLIIRQLKLRIKNLQNALFVLGKTRNDDFGMQRKMLEVFEKNNSVDPLTPNKIAGMLHWPELLDNIENENGFDELLRLFILYSKHEGLISDPSNCWILLAAKNYDQLLKHGYENFKRTIGHNYFNFLIQQGDPQIKAAEQVLPMEIVKHCKNLAQTLQKDPNFYVHDQASYYYFILLLWEYVKKIDVHHYLDRLQEPQEGGPILVQVEGKSMSQDLANSLIEYYSISEAVPFNKVQTVLEIGSGYGRNAHVILTLNPAIRVILVDIMPALYIAQRYLSSIFKNRRVFKARDFKTYEEVRDEMESASIVFLMPQQLQLLPDHSVNLVMNISSFGEMNLKQIDWYFDQINRVSSQYFYTKQWNKSQNPFDALVLKKADYPYRSHWKEIFNRQCAIQSEFFETLFQVNEPCKLQIP